MLAALGNGRTRARWYSLIDKVYRGATLRAAWQQLRGNLVSTDSQGVAAFDAHADTNLTELEDALRSGRYQPPATEALDIPGIKDRIAQTALKMAIEPIFEAMFLNTSYGYRPTRGASEALRDAERMFREGRTHVADLDLTSAVAHLPHEQVIERVQERISDRRVLALIDAWLRQGIMARLANVTNPATAGQQHGAVLAPLLANVVLHPLDVRMKARGCRMVRHAGHMLILCRTAQDAQHALRDVHAWAGEHGLALGSDSALVRDCRRDGEGFHFLGQQFAAGMARLPVQNRLLPTHPFFEGADLFWQARLLAQEKAMALNS
ncbi:hypothetical protein GCM10027343_15030 [Noviherbaspirillum agri]